MFGSSCSITRLAQPQKAQFIVVNEQFWGKRNKVSEHDGTNTNYMLVKTNNELNNPSFVQQNHPGIVW